jgi:hypothetical protein
LLLTNIIYQPLQDEKGVLITIEEDDNVEVPVIKFGEVHPPTYEWIHGDEVIARAYDVPIIGYDTVNTVNLRYVWFFCLYLLGVIQISAVNL